MKNQKGFIPVIIILVVLIGFVGVYYLGTLKSNKNVEVNPTSVVSSLPSSIATSKSASPNPTTNWKDYNFSPLKLSLKVPQEFTVDMNEPNVGKDFTARIQNKTFNSGVLKDSYQLYVQWQDMPITEAELKNLKLDLDQSSVSESTIDGYKTINGQIKGDRNRFVTYIVWNGTKISLYTAEATQINKEITNQILSTFKFTN